MGNSYIVESLKNLRFKEYGMRALFFTMLFFTTSFAFSQTGFRYFKLEILGQVSTYDIYIAEIDWKVNTTAYPISHYTASSPNITSTSGSGNWNAYNGVTDAFPTWNVGTTTYPQSITIDLGAGTSILPTTVEITPQWEARTPSAFKCYASTDNSNWVTIANVSGLTQSSWGRWITKSFPLSYPDTQAPTAPTGLASSAVTQTSFTLNWTASTDNVGVVSYEVFRNGTSVGTTASTSMALSGLTCGTSYAITVKAKDAANNVSAASSTLNVTTSSCPDTQAPTAPTGLASSGISQTSFTLNWTASTDNVGVVSYEVFRNGTSVGTTASTSMALSGLTCGTSYAITVKAKDAANNVSAASSTLNVSTSACPDTQAPTAPTGLASSGISQTSFTLNWTASTDNVGVVSYEVFRNGTSVGTSSTTSLNITGLTASTTYAMTVKAKDAAGNVSAASSALNVSTLAPSQTGFRYFKLEILGQVSTYDIYIAEIDWKVNTTAYPISHYTASSPNITSTSGTGNWNAYDGVTDAFPTWNLGTTTYPQSITIDLGAGTSILPTTVEITPQWEARTPSAFKCYASNDNSTWVTIANVSGLTQSSWGKWVTNSFPLSYSTDTQAPTAPTGLASSSISQTSFTLSWTASTDNVGVVSYEVFRNGTSIGTTSSTSMAVPGLTCGTSYAMTVKAKDAAGNVSAASSTLNVSTSACSDTQAPTAPTGLASSGISQTSFTLSWTASTDNVGVVSYEIYAGATSKGTSATTSFNVTGLSAGTQYSMTVKAKDAANNVSAASSALNVTTSPSVPSTRKMYLGMNTGGFNDYNADKPFADVMRTARSYYTGSDVNANNVPKDAAGWPTTDFHVLVYHGLTTNSNQGTYKLYFNGKATVTSSEATITNMSYNSSTNLSTADVVIPVGNTQLFMNWSATQRTNASATNTGVTNIKLMRPTTVGGTTAYATNVIWNPQFIAAIAPFTVIRTMGWTNTNGGQLDSDWNSTYIRPWNYATLNSGSNGAPGRTCWEAIVSFANATDKDVWINIPHLATDAYITKIMQTFRYGSDGNGNPYTSTQSSPVIAPLESNLKLYVEYSNEIWNWAGPYKPQTQYCQDQGALSSVCKFDGSTDVATLTYRYKAQRSVEISNICRQVFGSADMMTRIRPVLCWQQANNNLTQMSLNFVDKYYNKRDSRSPVTTPHPVNYYFYGGGGSAYWYSDGSSTLTTETIWDSNTYNPEAFYNKLRNDACWAKVYGLEYINYEGDHHYSGSDQTVSRMIQWDNRQEAEAVEHFRKLSELEGILFNWLALTSQKGDATDWGMLNGSVTNTNFPQYRASTYWNALSSQDAVTLGGVVPFSRAGNAYDINTYQTWSTTTYSNTGTLTLTANNNVYAPGFAFKVNSDGSYNAQIEYTSSAAATVVLEVNGVAIGTLNLPAASSNTASAFVNFSSLTNKLYVLRVVCTSGSIVLRKVNFGTGLKSAHVVTDVASAKANSVKIYPNPASDRFTIETSSNNAIVSIHDLSGKLVYENQINNSTEQISTQNMKPGIYIVTVMEENRLERQKLIIR